MESMASNFFMHTFQKAGAHDVVSQVDPATQNEAVLQMTGLPPDALLHSCWEASTFRPAHVVLLDRPFRRIILTIRGTLTPEDALTDIGAMTSPFRGGHVHRGMLDSAEFVVSSCMPYIDTCLENLGGEIGDYSLVVTGHSLGAGVASIVTLLLQENFAGWGPQRLHCYAFAPPAVFNESLADECSESITSVILGCDMIPRTSAANVDFLIHELIMNTTRTKVIDMAGDLIGGNVKTFADERREELEALVVREGDQKHYAPGRLLLLDMVEDELPRMAYAEMGDVDRLLIHGEMVADHLPSKYLNGISAVLTSVATTSNLPLNVASI